MTLQELWKATTADIYLTRKGQEPLKLPSGGRLQIEHAEKKVWRIQIRARASESPYLLVDAVEVGTDSHASDTVTGKPCTSHASRASECSE